MNSKVIVFGAGSCGKNVALNLKKNDQLLCFIDNDCNKWGQQISNGFFCYGPEALSDLDYDKIIIGTLAGFNEVTKQLVDLGVSYDKIITNNIETNIRARESFLRRFAQLYKGGSGAVAEVGVFRGEFAKIINNCFPDKKCYLFDTFEGFDARDIEYENDNKNAVVGNLADTTIDLVKSKLPFPEKCIFKKGYFPDTFSSEIIDEFFFVNLDLDLYKPTLEGLRIFYPRMVKGGCILVHDYFSIQYPNIKKAVQEFVEEQNQDILVVPIGDDISVAIIRLA